eukprot:TRINITY_DN4688_c0_g1_i2.p1 TRINITY_DN4688_c0_g1~~TRINITY_DN4688_c0_g1_i2.p1  ORF type:complete len:294 (+),score=7.95 TRINITY_DN4688_c0_g1_i2:592-1473(+)
MRSARSFWATRGGKRWRAAADRGDHLKRLTGRSASVAPSRCGGSFSAPVASRSPSAPRREDAKSRSSSFVSFSASESELSSSPSDAALAAATAAPAWPHVPSPLRQDNQNYEPPRVQRTAEKGQLLLPLRTTHVSFPYSTPRPASSLPIFNGAMSTTKKLATLTLIAVRTFSSAPTIEVRIEKPPSPRHRSSALQATTRLCPARDAIATRSSCCPLPPRAPRPPKQRTTPVAPLGARSHARPRSALYVMLHSCRRTCRSPANDWRVWVLESNRSLRLSYAPVANVTTSTLSND